MVLCRPLTAELRVRLQVSPCEICSGQSGYWDVLINECSRTSLIRAQVIRIGSALHVNLSRIIHNFTSLEITGCRIKCVKLLRLPELKSSLVESSRCRYVLLTSERQIAPVAYFK